MLPLKKGVHYKRFDQILLVAQFQAGIDRFGDGDHNLLILHLAVTVFADQQQDVIDVDFDLLDQFHFKDDVIVDNVLRRLLSLPVLMVEIEIDALVILPVPLRKNFQLGRLYRLPRFKARFAHSGPPADHFSRILPNFSYINFFAPKFVFFIFLNCSFHGRLSFPLIPTGCNKQSCRNSFSSSLSE